MENLLKILLFLGVACYVEAKKQCFPVKNNTCGEHEAWTSCGSLCTEPKCPRYGFEELMCAALCIEGCFCEDGYVRDPTGKCVLLEQCPPVTCPANQHWTDCGARCEPTCDNPILSFCPLICLPGCVCDEGFVKNQEGECVTVDQCPPRQCSDNEEFLEFGSPCESTCTHPGDIFCKAASRPGCFCKQGYLRDENNKCILPDECPPVECSGENEVFNACGSTCGDLTCENPSFAAITCAAGCGRGCYCEDGFVRRNDGVCVPQEACEPIGHCPANEFWSDCAPADGCEATCDPNQHDNFCIDMCFQKCVCIKGYVRNEDGYCIPKEDCPIPECGENEVYTSCGSGCGDLTCEMRSLEAAICPAVCTQGCLCAPGYVRDVSGKCILADECPTCPEKERYTQCGAACEPTCANQNPLICPAICLSGCVCDYGLVRNAEGKCVEPNECPKPECKEHEHYTDCGSACGDLTCSMQSYAAVLCPAVCVSGCYCDDGYVRNDEGICVPVSTCGCKENEKWNECGPVDSCEATCKNPDLIDVICPDVCVAKCVCKEGYVRDSNYNCVPRDSCSAVSCGENEIYTTCGSGCGDLTCQQPSHDICLAVCRVGCFCAPGYVRDHNGKCILVDQCPNTECGENEHYDECGPNGCQNTCENPDYESICVNVRCQEGCYCNKGYIRRDDGKCVLPEECPNIHCNDNEEYRLCGFGGCENTCAEPQLQTMCLPPGCVPGCYCKYGFLRDSHGKCLLPEECPAEKCGKNEHYEECGIGGCQNTCINPTFSMVCRPAGCQKGCYCDEGYVRDNNGNCVLLENCPSECGEHEHFECGPNGCHNTCDEPERETYCRNVRCEDGCYCDKGYVRRDDGKCVLQDECPQKCGENEEYFPECGPGACENTCTQPEKQLVCKAKCEPGCFCSPGFVRNEETGNCVPIDSCPSGECGKNEFYTDCGSGCGDLTCERPSLEGLICPAVCIPGCFCVEGFVRNSKKQCIPVEECAKKCGKNEEFLECGSPCQSTCEHPGPIFCKAACRPGCFCKKGFVLDDKNRCIDPKRCGRKKKGDNDTVSDKTSSDKNSGSSEKESENKSNHS